MGGIVNTSDQSSKHNLDTLKNTLINEEITIIGMAEVNINWSKIPIKYNMYRRVPAQDLLFALILWYVAKTLFRL